MPLGLVSSAGATSPGATQGSARAALADPYASDRSSAPASALPDDEDAWRAVIGSNEDYYLPKLLEAARSGGHFRWHWPAFFVTGYWLLYRKMWGWAVLYLFVLPVLTSMLIGAVAAALGPDASRSLAIVGIGYALLYLVVPPLFANQLYFGHCRSVIATAQSRTTDRSRQLAYLDAKGGTSGAAIILIVFLGISIIGILAAVAVPAYQDYTIRAKVSEALASGLQIAREYGAAYEAKGSAPDDFEEMKTHATSRFLSRIELNPSNSVIDLDVQVSPTLTVPLSLAPSLDENKHIVWGCSTTPRMQKYVPRACRTQRPAGGG